MMGNENMPEMVEQPNNPSGQDMMNLIQDNKIGRC